MSACHEKVRHYARILRDAARHDRPNVQRPLRELLSRWLRTSLPLVYRDTNTTRAGLHGTQHPLPRPHNCDCRYRSTGSYILDQVAKTWVDRIVLIDGDIFDNHNAFRAPGAAAVATLQARRNKAEYFAEEYSRMHTGITAHAESPHQGQSALARKCHLCLSCGSGRARAAT